MFCLCLKSMSWTDPVELTDTQKKLVSKTMSSLRPKLNEFGVHVFKTIFQMRPDLKKHFGFEHQVTMSIFSTSLFKTTYVRIVSNFHPRAGLTGVLSS